MYQGSSHTHRKMEEADSPPGSSPGLAKRRSRNVAISEDHTNANVPVVVDDRNSPAGPPAPDDPKIAKIKYTEEDETRLRSQYFWMSLLFGLIFGGTACSTSILTSLVGDRVGSGSNGVFYLSAALSALVLGVPAVESVGPLKAMVIGGALQAVYLMLLWFAAHNHDFKKEDSKGTTASNAGEGGGGSSSFWEAGAAPSGAGSFVTNDTFFTVAACVAGLGLGPFWAGKGVFYANTCEAISRCHSASSESTSEEVPPLQQDEAVPLLASSPNRPAANSPGTNSSPNDSLPEDPTLSRERTKDKDVKMTKQERRLEKLDEAGLQLGVLFGALFLGFEFLIKIGAGGVLSLLGEDKKTDVFAVFGTLTASASLLLLLLVTDPPEAGVVVATKKDDGAPYGALSMFAALGSVTRLFYDAPYVMLVSIMNITFGGTVVLVLSYMNRHIVKRGFNNEDQYVAMFASVPVLAAGCFTLIVRCTPPGKNYLPALAASLAMGVIPLCLWLGVTKTPPPEPAPPMQSNYTALIVYIAQGIARATFETANRAMFLEVFSGTPFVSEAFASIQVTHSGAVALGLFFAASSADAPLVVRDVLCVGITVLSIVLVPAYFVARNRAQQDKIAEVVEQLQAADKGLVVRQFSELRERSTAQAFLVRSRTGSKTDEDVLPVIAGSPP
ncbi:unnamed protein product [Amoebophrya sp. A120]|nr:unnamed protein product [Amoebophrya sp. A120]|eukprot:GSA120T00011192001.1